MNVYAILLESGAVSEGQDLRRTEVYLQSLKLGLIAAPGDRPPAPPPDAEVREEVFQLSGLWCTACGWLVEHALAREPGVVAAEVLFTSDLLKVRYCPQYLPPQAIPERVASLGYRAAPFGTEDEAGRKAWQDLILRLGLSFFLWMNVMLFSLVVYAGYFGRVADWARGAIPFILMVLALPSVAWGAWPVHRIALYGLRHGRIRMETLLSTGILSAYGYSSAQAFLHGRHFYFDTACAIVALVLLGKALERGAKDASAKGLATLHRLMPRKARIRVGGEEHFVAIEALQAGMVILVKAGERIPADGAVVAGRSSVDESVITGESVLKPKGEGDAVVCGSLNGSGLLEIRVLHAGEDSTLAQIVRSVETALAARSSLERTVDKVAQVFIPAVLAVALATFAGGLLLGLGHTEAILRGISVMVIACPCALGIATPLATTAAVGGASRKGILVRDVGVLETFRKVSAVVLDKTGTMTEGAFRVRASRLERLDLLATLESYSEHPIGQAVVAHAKDRGLRPGTAADLEVLPGQGIAGTVDGLRVACGNRRMMEREGVPPPPEVNALASDWQAEGLTVVFLAVAGEPAGALALGDAPREDAAALVAAFRVRGVKTLLLSGDARATTSHLGRRLGVDECLGEVPPAGKADAVKRLQARGMVVAMVGDGVNDAPALAASDLGIALGSGADLAQQAAPVVLLGPGLMRIEETFRMAARTQRIIRQNLFWAFLYNCAGISLAILGVLTPILAAGAMVLSSLSVIGNSLRLGKDA
jgi:heavy metal translocating P-type ATPase